VAQRKIPSPRRESTPGPRGEFKMSLKYSYAFLHLCSKYYSLHSIKCKNQGICEFKTSEVKRRRANSTPVTLSFASVMCSGFQCSRICYTTDTCQSNGEETDDESLKITE